MGQSGPVTMIAAAVLAACVSATPTIPTSSVASTEPRGAARFAEDPRLGKEIESACFARNIRGFSENTEDTVILRRSINTRYLIEMAGECIDLEQAKTIALINRQRCVRPGDRIFVSRFVSNLDDGDFTTGLCTISAVYAWDHRAAEQTTDADTPDAPS